MPRPMPRLPPVTTATLPERKPIPCLPRCIDRIVSLACRRTRSPHGTCRSAPRARAPSQVMPGLELVSVSKVYGNSQRAVDRVSLAVEPGEFLVLVGPSGCGKSSLLRMIAGLEEISEGEIRISD